MEQVSEFEFRRGRGEILVIACGALGREIVHLIERNGWQHLDVQCLPAAWHHTPAKITEGVRTKIRAAKPKYANIYVAYADCGTGGALDRMLLEENVERIEGPHCFSFYAGNEVAADRADADMTAFFLTDFFVRHFDEFVWRAFALDRRADMVDFVFSGYTKLVYIGQTDNAQLQEKARHCAAKLKLEYEYRPAGYGDLAPFLAGANAVNTK